MKSWAKLTAKTVLVTTGFAAAGGGFAGVAYADTGGTNAGNLSILSGNQISVPVSIPVDLCGNAAALLGIATAGCQGGAEVISQHGQNGKPVTSSSGQRVGNVSAASGNSVQIPVKIAANACGNAVGNARAVCQGGATVPGGEPGGQTSGTARQSGLSAGNIAIGDGNHVSAPVAAPVNVCGVAAAVLGVATATCEGGASVTGLANGLPVSSGGPLAGQGAQPAGQSDSSAGQSGQSAGQGNLLAGQNDQSASQSDNSAGQGNQSAGQGNQADSQGNQAAGQAGPLSSAQLASLGTLPGLANLPVAAGLGNMPLLQGLNSGSSLLPASSLSALSSNVGGGMSADSFVTLAVGALLAGAAALKLAGRRSRGRKAKAGEVSA